MAAKLDEEESIGGIGFTNEEIYAYCFEPPMGAERNKIIYPDLYKNIHNIVNPSDPVPKVAPSIQGWEFARYGIDEPVIPTRLTSSNTELYDKMLKRFKSLQTPDGNKSLVADKNDADGDGDTQETIHTIDAFQAKKINPHLEFNPKGHWEWNMNIVGTMMPVYVPDLVDFHWISDSGKSMEAFLNDVVFDLFTGMGGRVNYTLKLQSAVRLVMAQTLGGGYETYKWSKVPDIFTQKLQDNIIPIAVSFLTAGSTGVEAAVLALFVDSASEAGIDIVSYASLPIALREALVSVVSAFVLSIFTSGGNDFITLCYNITRLFSAHYPELCLAWLQIQDSNYDSEGQKIEACRC